MRPHDCILLLMVGLPVIVIMSFPEGTWLSRLGGWMYISILGLELVAGISVWRGSRRWTDKRLNARNRKLAEAGNTVAITNLGISRLSCNTDAAKAEAANWFCKAAEAGDIGGMINLADMYENGLGGLEKDAM